VYKRQRGLGDVYKRQAQNLLKYVKQTVVNSSKEH
jgi:hypothetical protein